MKATAPNDPRFDFSTIPDETIKEFHRQAELRLESSVKLAIAADSRATALTATLGAATAALLVLGSNLIVSERYDAALVCAVFMAAGIAFLAAAFCAVAAKPSEFFVTGYEPRHLHAAAMAADENDLLRVSAEDIQTRILLNDARLRISARTLAVGRFFAATAIPIGLLTYLFAVHLGYPTASHHAPHDHALHAF